MLNARSAIILNFTGNTYHWGCYATSMEIYESLIERGYYVNYVSAEATHSFFPSPGTREQMFDPHFMHQALDANRTLYTALKDVDLVVVNGEGTLHGSLPGPRNLLFFMQMARHFLDKPLHLINHSFYPSDDMCTSEIMDSLCGDAVRSMNRIVPREIYSAAIYKRLGIPVVQGFDCLPRFLQRHRVEPERGAGGPIVLSGGVNMTEAAARAVARTLARRRLSGRTTQFLTGAKRNPAPEDMPIFACMKAELPALELVTAKSLADWLATIAGASCLISGRFHHTIAAAFLETPVIVFPSNTPKNAALCEMLGLEAPLRFDDPELEHQLECTLDVVQTGHGKTITPAKRQEILDLAAHNFDGI